MFSIRKVAGMGIAPALMFAMTLAGCNGARDDLPREAVSGKVKIEGAPVATGSISFRSPEMEVGGLVKDGAFTIPRADGPVPGKYQVTLTEGVEGPSPKDGTAEHFSIQPKTKPSKTAPPAALEAEVKAGENEPFDFDFQRVAGSKSKGGSR